MATPAVEIYDLLASLFCLPGEFDGDPDIEEASLSRLRDGKSPSIDFTTLKCTIHVSPGEDASRSLALHVQLPVDGHTVRLHLAQPAWLARRPYEKLSEELRSALAEAPSSDEDPSAHVLAAVEYLKEQSSAYLPMIQTMEAANQIITRLPTDSLVYVGTDGCLHCA